MTNFPGYWKRLIKRGVLHECGQRRGQERQFTWLANTTKSAGRDSCMMEPTVHRAFVNLTRLIPSSLQLPTPAVGVCSADHKTIEAAHNRLVPWQQAQGPRLPSADDGPTEGFVNDIDLAVEIVSYLDDPPSQCPDDLSAGLRERAGGSVISWTTLMSTLSRVDG